MLIINNSIKKTAGLLVFCLVLLSTTVIAQQEPQMQPEETTDSIREDFTEKELESFVKANEKIIQIQQESEQKIVKAIEDEGLSVERFTEILEAQQNPGKDVNASAEELQSFNKAAQVIITEGQKAQMQLLETLQQEGIDVDTYHDILYAYQQSPNVQDKIHKIEQERN